VGYEAAKDGTDTRQSAAEESGRRGSDRFEAIIAYYIPTEKRRSGDREMRGEMII
jgi:hypothetical protein